MVAHAEAYFFYCLIQFTHYSFYTKKHTQFFAEQNNYRLFKTSTNVPNLYVLDTNEFKTFFWHAIILKMTFLTTDSYITDQKQCIIFFKIFKKILFFTTHFSTKNNFCPILTGRENKFVPKIYSLTPKIDD